MDMKALGENLVSIVKTYTAAAVKSLSDRIDSLDARISDLPTPKDGRDGKDGADGIDGADGKSVGLDDVLPAITADFETWRSAAEQRVTDKCLAAIEAMPKPKDGEDGKSLTLDDVQFFLEASFSKWALEAERRFIDAGQKAIDSLPLPVNGKDGLGFEDLTVEQKSPRLIAIKFVRGDECKAFEFRIPAMIYRGVFTEGEAYEQGDTVTWAGSLWHAKELTRDKPGTDAWQLAAKRGQDGKSYGVKL